MWWLLHWPGLEKTVLCTHEPPTSLSLTLTLTLPPLSPFYFLPLPSFTSLLVFSLPSLCLVYYSPSPRHLLLVIIVITISFLFTSPPSPSIPIRCKGQSNSDEIWCHLTHGLLINHGSWTNCMQLVWSFAAPPNPPTHPQPPQTPPPPPTPGILDTAGSNSPVHPLQQHLSLVLSFSLASQPPRWPSG